VAARRCEGRPGEGAAHMGTRPLGAAEGGRPEAGRLRGRDFLSLHDFTPAEVAGLVAAALAYKRHPWPGQPLGGRSVALLFLKPSTRTRVAFDVAAAALGAHPVALQGTEMQLARGETVADTGRVLSQLVDAIVIRAFGHAEVEELAAAASVPVVNALTDLLHPSQAVADLTTLAERFGRLPGLTLAYVGDGNNVCHSLCFGAAKTGMHLRLGCPAAFGPHPQVLEAARADARETGASIEVLTDPREAVRGADAVYTDAWVSMGFEASAVARRQALQPYRVDAALMALAAPHAIFLHDLPAHRGEEVTDEVMDGPQSAVFQQAGNRLHAAKAILAAVV
jgi:ornithine carbamoyltransferase